MVSKEVMLDFKQVVDRYPNSTPAETGLKFRNEFPGSMLHAYFSSSGSITAFTAIFSTEEAETFFWLKW